MSRARRGCSRRPQHHPTVGYGHPPETHRFAPGQSGNPRGRPKGATSRRPAQPPDRLMQIVLDEASRQISVREGDRTVTLSMAQAIIRRLFVDAAKGAFRAQRHFTEILTLSENEAPRTPEQDRRPFKITIVKPEPRQPEKDRRPEDDPAAGT